MMSTIEGAATGSRPTKPVEAGAYSFTRIRNRQNASEKFHVDAEYCLIKAPSGRKKSTKAAVRIPQLAADDFASSAEAQEQFDSLLR
jgi:hypothetical protein